MKALRWLLLLPLVATAQIYYPYTTIPPTIAPNTFLGNSTGSTATPQQLTSPYSFGSALVPTYLNSYTITGTVTAGSTTFICVTGCASLVVGQGITGSDGVNLIYPSVQGQLGALITVIAGATITTSNASNVLTIPGTYTLTIGKDRWSTTSTALVNTIGTQNRWGGQAALGNSTWAQGWLSGDCDTGAKVTNCDLMNSGASSAVLNFWGARTSDNTSTLNVIENITLAVNDDTVHSKTIWGHYWETILMPGAGGLNETHAMESTTYNYNSTVRKVDPYAINIIGEIENLRLDCGQPNVGTLYNCTDAMSVIGIAGTPFESGIVFATGSLDEVTLSHPPALGLPAGATGYGISWYEATGYTTPAWNIYSTNTAVDGNTLALDDADATFSIVTSMGTGTATIGSGSFALAGNHLSTFGTTGLGFDVAGVSIRDATSSGTITTTNINHIGTPTLVATNPVTLTNVVNFAIDNAPVAGSGVTIGTSYSFLVQAGTSRFNGSLISAGDLNIGTALYASVTAPTITSGFNTSGQSITAPSTAAFRVTVGTGAGTTTGVLAMPAATTGWACSVADVTTPATNMVQQTGSTTTSVTVTNYVRTTGVAGNFTNSDKLVFVCGAF